MRDFLKMTQTEFGFSCGVSANTVYRWEQEEIDQRRYPSRQHNAKLNQLLHQAKEKGFVLPDDPGAPVPEPEPAAS